MAELKVRPKKKLKIRSKDKSYTLKDSPFYNLSTKKALAELLYISLSDIKRISRTSNYNVFQLGEIPKQREIQAPKLELNIIHTRIASLLVRIKTPDYLHSGIKKRSYISNAKVHVGDFPVLTMDIRKFYPSVTKTSVFNFFKKYMNTSADVAGILAELSCYEDHIPTGSRLSMPLAYWANNLMYSRIDALCKSKDIRMTVYVDDLTFSGKNVNRLFQKQIEELITSCGFEFHPDKTRLYSRISPKLITGVVVDNEKILLSNKHHKSIYELFNDLEKFSHTSIDKSVIDKLTGKMNAASQIDSKFKQRVKQFDKDYK